MDTLKETIISLSMGDLTRAAGGMKKLSSFGTSELFQGISEITRDLHESIKDIQSFLEPILKHIKEQEIEGLSNKLAHVSKLVKDVAEQTLDLLFARLEVALIDVSMYEMIVKLIDEGDKKGAVANLATLKVHNDELVNKLTRISELQIHADLVDQLIKKVSKVVEEIEQRLIEFIQHFGHLIQAEPKTEHPKVEVLHGPVVPGRVKGAATSQDAVDDLLKSLGM